MKLYHNNKDRMYCKTCKKLFCDYAKRGRKKGNVIINCPHCLSKNTVNASQIMEKILANKTKTFNQYTKDRKRMFEEIQFALKQENI